MEMSEALTRRQALKRIFKAIAATGASRFISFNDVLAAETTPDDDKVNVIWLHGASCSGCSISFLNIEYVRVIDILTKFTNLLFHPDISLASGAQVQHIHEQLPRSGRPYILIVEGGIPAGMPHACVMMDKPIGEWVAQLAARAAGCIAAGTCAALGGVPKMKGTLTGSQTLSEFLRSRHLATPVVNLPGCPMKPEHLVYTVLHYAKQATLPACDGSLRPVQFFAHTVHERCSYYADFQEKRFAEFIGDRGCLLKLGCQGPVTRNDCPSRGHNGNTNTCIRAGHPCIGCASEHFPRQIMLHRYNDDRPILGKHLKWLIDQS
jgi:hydrogenase small subunit